MSNLIAKIDKGRQVGNLSSAIRIFVLEHFRAKANGQAEIRPLCQQRKKPRLALPLCFEMRHRLLARC